jgi:hypothetical protein
VIEVSGVSLELENVDEVAGVEELVDVEVEVEVGVGAGAGVGCGLGDGVGVGVGVTAVTRLKLFPLLLAATLVVLSVLLTAILLPSKFIGALPLPRTVNETVPISWLPLTPDVAVLPLPHCLRVVNWTSEIEPLVDLAGAVVSKLLPEALLELYCNKFAG